MRFALIVIAAFLALTAATVSGYACPKGYTACGTRSCCPL
jgi:hypothetical protein